MNLYVGNLSYEVTEEELQKAFEEFGQVESSKIIKDAYTGKSKGFGFVEMPEEPEALTAIENLDGKELKGRNLKISKARPRTQEHRGRGGYEGGRRF
ncbi:MAG: RNA-binding protein [Pseudomonadota bacterium]